GDHVDVDFDSYQEASPWIHHQDPGTDPTPSVREIRGLCQGLSPVPPEVDHEIREALEGENGDESENGDGGENGDAASIDSKSKKPAPPSYPRSLVPCEFLVP